MASISPILEHLIGVYKVTNKPINVLEIGARYGDSSSVLLDNLPINKYIIIDPYTDYEDYKNDGFNNIILNDRAKNRENKIYENTKNRLLNTRAVKENGTSIIFHRTFSNDKETINKIDDNSLDLIFIDGNHTYKYVLEDLENYYPKLKLSQDGKVCGIMCGDDFFMRSHSNDHLNSMPGKEGYDEPMVYEAVVDFCNKYNKKYKEFGKHRSYGKIFMIVN